MGDKEYQKKLKEVIDRGIERFQEHIVEYSWMYDFDTVEHAQKGVKRREHERAKEKKSKIHGNPGGANPYHIYDEASGKWYNHGSGG